MGKTIFVDQGIEYMYYLFFLGVFVDFHFYLVLNRGNTTSVMSADSIDDAISKFMELKDSDYDSVKIDLNFNIDCSDITKEKLDECYFEVQKLNILPKNIKISIYFDIELDNPEKITNVKLKVQAVICNLPKNAVKLSFKNTILSGLKSYRSARYDVAATVFTDMKIVRTLVHPKFRYLSKLHHMFNRHSSGARENQFKEEFLIVKVAGFIGKYILEHVTECSISGFSTEGLLELMPNAQFYFSKELKNGCSGSNLNLRMHLKAQEQVNKISELIQAEVTNMPAGIINLITGYGVCIPTINAEQTSRIQEIMTKRK